MKALQVFSSEEMKMYDAWVGAQFKIPEGSLVEHAGRECFRVLLEICDLTSIRSALFVCGSGGNGADGLVMARLLKCFSSSLDDAISIEVLITKPIDQQRDLNRGILLQLEALGIEPRYLEDIKTDDRTKLIKESEIIVDALLGTGASGLLSGSVLALLRDIRESRSESSKLIAVDIPSGLMPDVDVIQDDPYEGGNVDITLVIQGFKIAQMAPGSERYCGQAMLLDIGMPRFEEKNCRDSKYFVTKDQVVSYLDNHSNSYLGHKGQRGHVLVIGGSDMMCGAPMLSSLAVFKAGAGKVTTTFPNHKTCSDVAVMSLPLATEGGCYSENSIGLIREALSGKQALVLGPGLGLNTNIYNLVKTLLVDIKNVGIPCVLDADALTIVSRIRDLEPLTLTENFVLTPHVGEFLRLEKAYFKDSLLSTSRYQAISRLAHAMQANILLKGPKSLFFSLKSGAFYNPHQSASLAVAGSGDVLAGLMAGFFARGYSVEEGTIVATFLHGYAGEILDQDFLDGVGVDAKTILETIPIAYRELLLA